MFLIIDFPFCNLLQNDGITPSNGIISIESKSSLFGSSYRVYSIKGVELLSGSITSKITTLNIQDWAEGVYLIRVGNDAKQTCKIIKQ